MTPASTTESACVGTFPSEAGPIHSAAVLKCVHSTNRGFGERTTRRYFAFVYELLRIYMLRGQLTLLVVSVQQHTRTASTLIESYRSGFPCSLTPCLPTK
jgi:hypothetical protein